MNALAEAISTVVLGLVLGLMLRKILVMRYDSKDKQGSSTKLLRSTEIDLLEKKQKSTTKTNRTIPELKKQLKELKKIVKK